MSPEAVDDLRQKFQSSPGPKAECYRLRCA